MNHHEVTSRDGIPLVFEAHGAGAPAVVLVHGWSCDRGYWDGQVGPLAARYRTVAVDLTGHSMGGDVIVEAALRLGDRVAGLVWADVYSTLGDPDIDDELDAFAAPFREDFVPATRAFVRRLFPPDAEQGHTDTAALRRHGVQPVLMPGVGHFLMMEDPEVFNRLLIDAIEGFSA